MILDLVGQRERNREKHIADLVMSMGDIVFFKDAEGRWLSASDSAVGLFDLQGVDYWGKDDRDLADYSGKPEAMIYCLESDQVAWQAGKEFRCEETVYLNGQKYVYDVTKKPVFDKYGKKRGLIVISRDITAAKALEDDILNSFLSLQAQRALKLVK